MKSSEEYHQIREALIHWFESQSIDPSDAGVVMGTLIINITAELAKNRSDMEEGIRAFVEGFENVAEKIKNDAFPRETTKKTGS